MPRRFQLRAANTAAPAVNSATRPIPTGRGATGDTIVFGHAEWSTLNHVNAFQTDTPSDTAARAATSNGRAASASGRPSSRNGTAGAKKRGPGERPPIGSK